MLYQLVTCVLKMWPDFALICHIAALRLCHVTALMFFCLSSGLSNELFLISTFKIKLDSTRQRGALSLAKIGLWWPFTTTFSQLDGLKGIRLRSAWMNYYILIINDKSDFIRVNNHQVTKNYITPSYKMDYKLSIFSSELKSHQDWCIIH